MTFFEKKPLLIIKKLNNRAFSLFFLPIAQIYSLLLT